MSKNQTVLFHSCVFGPVHSRRLGVSLGINLSPDDGKVCSFDCIYCEAGYNAQGTGSTGLPSRTVVAEALEARLKKMSNDGDPLDVITFSGNGEPTLNPDFPAIVNDTLRLRDRYYPSAKVSVLSNSTHIDSVEVADALKRVDNNILKLDSAIDSTMRLIDQPMSKSLTVERLIEQLTQFSKQCIIQTMMLRGSVEGKVVDNTIPEEVNALCEAYKLIAPREVMLYSIDRSTPCETISRIPAEELRAIGAHIESVTGIKVQVN